MVVLGLLRYREYGLSFKEFSFVGWVLGWIGVGYI